ncbi:LuxR C-terminal-related transcriptional regulator [Anabaena azotica]|uniref:Helix-turn-helix domain-containing protein n=1 Tax=Anabaena azotica FACHB-119 TaxID=947527 RepID=A0ABR8D9Z8_9NOST|nr:LuxR C-terminal-related transcriptional regulator [Anabaena azotica]MBD2503954.1 helix-turn-helix domain-containing protein [Anabaena azotica FACHB-119]
MNQKELALLYQKIARQAAQKIYRQSVWWYESNVSLYSLIPGKANFDDLCSEGVYGILKGLKCKPEMVIYPAYMYTCARQQILKYLFRNWLKNRGFQNEMKLNQGSSFIEREPDKIFDFLLNSRKKKGDRGTQAAIRDLQILLLVAAGWQNHEIASELNLPASHVRDYRKAMRKRFGQYLKSQESQNVAA